MRTAMIISGAFAAAMMLTAVPASAQTTTTHAFCLQKSGESQALNCLFDTMAACEAEAKTSQAGGEATALCVANPQTASNDSGMKKTDGMGSDSMSKEPMKKQ